MTLSTYCYVRIIWFTYQCKLDLFGTAIEEDEAANDAKLDPCRALRSPEGAKLDRMISQVDSKLIEAVSLVERKFTRLTLVAAMGFMTAWLPFSLLCMWELATPPDEIPVGMCDVLRHCRSSHSRFSRGNCTAVICTAVRILYLYLTYGNTRPL